MILEGEEKLAKRRVFCTSWSNGAGKSSTVKVMTTLLRPNQGDVLDHR